MAKKYLVKYYGGSIEIEAESTRKAIEKFESTYQDHWYAAYPLDNTVTSSKPAVWDLATAVYTLLSDRYLSNPEKWKLAI